MAGRFPSLFYCTMYTLLKVLLRKTSGCWDGVGVVQWNEPWANASCGWGASTRPSPVRPEISKFCKLRTSDNYVTGVQASHL